MATWNVTLTIGGTPSDITALVEVPSIKKTRRLFTEMRPNVNTCQFRALFLNTLAQALIAATAPVLCAITKDGVAYFTGYISPNYEITIKNGAKFMEFIAEDATLVKLGQTVNAITTYAGYAVCTPSATSTSLVHAAATAAGVTLAAGLPTISSTVPYVCILPEDKLTWAQFLSDLLFEYGYVYAFLDNGTMTIVQSVNTGTVTTTNTFTVNGTTGNVLGEIAIKKTPEKYDDIRISFQTVELRNGLVLFQDTTGGSGADDAKIPLAATADPGGKDYYPLGAKDGEVFSNWSNPDGLNIWIATSATLDAALGSGISLYDALSNYYRKCAFGYRNTSGAESYITRLRITGNAYVVTSKNIARSASSGKQLLEYEAKYIFSRTPADTLAKAIYQYYQYSDLSYTVRSKAAFSLGEYVLVSDAVYSGISAKCRVIGITYDEGARDVLEYQLEAVANFAALTITAEGDNSGAQATPSPQSLAASLARAQGLVGSWNANGFPEYPDGTATYFQDDMAATGWTASGLTLSIPSAGIMRATLTSTADSLYRDVVAMNGKTIRLRVRASKDCAIRPSYWNGSSVVDISSVSVGTAWVLIDCYLASGASNTSLYIRTDTLAVGDWYEIDWVYVGDGTYSTKLADNSGNGNHGTVYGCVPVDGMSGKALSGDGVNDYVSFGDVCKLTGALTISLWAKANVSITTSVLGLLAKYRSSGNQRQYILDLSSGLPRFVVSGDGVSASTVTAPSTALSTTQFEHLCAVYVPSTGIYLYRNGVMIASNTTSIPASLYNGVAPLELFRDLTGSAYTNVSIDEPRIYNRALSAKEINGLYLGIVAPAIYTPDVATQAPKYLGKFLDSAPVAHAFGDVYCRYSTTSGAANRGVFKWDGAWTRTESRNDIMMASADIAFLIAYKNTSGTAIYGTAADYASDATIQADYAFFQNAFIGFLEAHDILVRSSIRGGNRYDESGATVDGTQPGFWIGASGACKVAGIEFEGEAGGGVQWECPSIVGTPLNIPGIGGTAVAAMNGTDVAYIDDTNDDLRLYRWSGSSWSMVGSELNISGVGQPALAALNGTDVAFMDSLNADLRVYRWSGSSWSMVGSELNIAGAGIPTICALNATDIAYVDSLNKDLRVYRWSGSSWSMVGSELNLPAIASISALAALNSTDVAYFDQGDKDLRVYRWSGSSWSMVGSELNIPGTGTRALAGLNGTDVVYLDSSADLITIYRWNGSSWIKAPDAGLANSGGGLASICALNGTDIVIIDSNNEYLRLYRFPFAVSRPYSRKLTG